MLVDPALEVACFPLLICGALKVCCTPQRIHARGPLVGWGSGGVLSSRVFVYCRQSTVTACGSAWTGVDNQVPRLGTFRFLFFVVAIIAVSQIWKLRSEAVTSAIRGPTKRPNSYDSGQNPACPTKPEWSML